MKVAAAVPISTMPRPGQSMNRLGSSADRNRTMASITMLATMPIRVDGFMREGLLDGKQWHLTVIGGGRAWRTAVAFLVAGLQLIRIMYIM